MFLCSPPLPLGYHSMRSEHFFYLLIFDSLPFAAILGGVHPESFKTDSELGEYPDLRKETLRRSA